MRYSDGTTGTTQYSCASSCTTTTTRSTTTKHVISENCGSCNCSSKIKTCTVRYSDGTTGTQLYSCASSCTTTTTKSTTKAKSCIKTTCTRTITYPNTSSCEACKADWYAAYTAGRTKTSQSAACGSVCDIKFGPYSCSSSNVGSTCTPSGEKYNGTTYSTCSCS